MKDGIRRTCLILFVILGVTSLGLGVKLILSDENSRGNPVVDSALEFDANKHNKYYFDIMETTNNLDLYLADKYPIKDVSKLSDEVKTKFLLDTTCDVDKTRVSFKELEKVSNKYFYKLNLYEKTIKDSDGTVLYQFENDIYNYKKKVGYSYFVGSHVISDSTYNDRWIIEKKVYYMDTNMNGDLYQLKVYKNKDDIASGKPIKLFNKADYVLDENDYKSIESLLNTFVYTYKKIDGNYYIQSVTIKD